MNLFVVILMFVFNYSQLKCDSLSNINLPEEHLPYYYTAHPQLAERCANDPECPYKNAIKTKKYWGYEQDHQWGQQQYSIPECPGDHKGWVKSKFDQLNTFYSQGDFGFIKQQLNEMRIICAPLFPNDSMLECSDHMRYCRGRNIMINFTKLIDRIEPIRYKLDVLEEKDIGGYCELNQIELNERLDHISALQSWGPEMRYFTQLEKRPIENGNCDVVVERPTYIMKIDATVNMYHHFCDFFNLYASLHMNHHPDAFSTDVNILIWESYTYHSLFQDTWKAFTDHPLWDLKHVRGKTVCFKNVIFPLLPRMIFGLYYNTPLIYGCRKSGLFHAFSKHILHRLKIPIQSRRNRIVKVTLLSRDTRYRKILNEDELIETVKDDKDIELKRVIYNRDIPFKEQLEITANSDVLVGIHGAGLTHLMFLPDWASVFEIYNCQDANCYADLSRLRGLYYVTWNDTTKLTSETDGGHNGGAHAKFANYRFDPDEFRVLLKQATDHVKGHSEFVKFTDTGLEEGNHDEL